MVDSTSHMSSNCKIGSPFYVSKKPRSLSPIEEDIYYAYSVNLSKTN